MLVRHLAGDKSRRAPRNGSPISRCRLRPHRAPAGLARVRASGPGRLAAWAYRGPRALPVSRRSTSRSLHGSRWCWPPASWARRFSLLGGIALFASLARAIRPRSFAAGLPELTSTIAAIPLLRWPASCSRRRKFRRLLGCSRAWAGWAWWNRHRRRAPAPSALHRRIRRRFSCSADCSHRLSPPTGIANADRAADGLRIAGAALSALSAADALRHRVPEGAD